MGRLGTTPVRPRPTVYASPARAVAAEREAWLPIPNVDSLPAIEELVGDHRLVTSGQTQAITDTQPAPKPAPRQLKQQTRRRRRRRYLLLGLALLTVAAVAFVAPQLLPHPPAVTIRVDGKERISAETDAKSVRSALREHEVKLGPEDRVSPGLATKVTDGLAVDVFRALPVIVDFDGEVHPVNTTWPKPAQLVRQLNLDPDKISIVTAPTRLTQGASVVLRTLKDVTISVDGTQHAETTAALNVSEFLQQNGVVLGPQDQLTPTADTRLADGMTVTVARNIKDTAQADEPLPPPTIRRDDPGLPKGQEMEIQAGVAGVQRVTYHITKEDGQELARTPISKIPVQPPTPKIIAVGTAPLRRVESA